MTTFGVLRRAMLSMPGEGVEPSRPCGHGILNPARTPVNKARRRWYTKDHTKKLTRPGRFERPGGTW